jgi:hypothetical protein
MLVQLPRSLTFARFLSVLLFPFPFLPYLRNPYILPEKEGRKENESKKVDLKCRTNMAVEEKEVAHLRSCIDTYLVLSASVAVDPYRNISRCILSLAPDASSGGYHRIKKGLAGRLLNKEAGANHDENV